MNHLALAVALAVALAQQCASAATPPAATDFARYAEDVLTNTYQAHDLGWAVLCGACDARDDVLCRVLAVRWMSQARAAKRLATEFVLTLSPGRSLPPGA